VLDNAMTIDISDNASHQITKLVQKQGLPAGAGLRVGVKAGGCSGLSYVFDWNAGPAEHDQVFEKAGARVFVDPKSLTFLDGTVLDYDTSLISKGFVLNNPRAKATCGCGVSFSVS
jgi:iron-sulfur cluster assembly protein